MLCACTMLQVLCIYFVSWPVRSLVCSNNTNIAKFQNQKNLFFLQVTLFLSFSPLTNPCHTSVSYNVQHGLHPSLQNGAGVLLENWRVFPLELKDTALIPFPSAAAPHANAETSPTFHRHVLTALVRIEKTRKERKRVHLLE